MSIQVQQTPNPNARKFVLPERHFAGPVNYGSAADAAGDPLAAALFELPGVCNVFMVQDFVTVNKRAQTEWEPLQSEVLGVLAKHLDQYVLDRLSSQRNHS
jgi:hypothetical protein